jgi:hypothetical protein
MRRSVIFSCIVLFALCVSSAVAEKAYWLTFSDSSYYYGAGTAQIGRKFLMKIDQDGNILMDPVEIYAGEGKVPTGATAIWDQGDVVYFWTPAEFGSNGFKIGRGIFDIATNTVTSFVVTNLETSDPEYLQAGKYNNGFAFLTFEKPPSGGGEQPPAAPQREDNGSLRAAEVNTSGLPTNNRWRLCPRTDGGNDQGGLAADGRFALSNDHDSPPDKLYTQRLNSLNTPAANPKVVTNFEDTFADIESVDITNDQGNGLRFVLYQLGFGDRAIDPTEPAIVLQRVDSTTGDKKGKPILISDDFRFDWRQVIAVDPDGDFVIFSSAGDAVPVTGIAGAQECEDLVYQALNNKGQPSGSPIVLLDGCDLEIFSFMGLDIALD